MIKRYLPIATVCLLTLLLASCAIQNSTESFPGQWQPTSARSVSDHVSTAERYFAKANSADSPEKEQYELIAAREWTLAGMVDEAQTVFQTIHPSTLNSELKISWQLLASRLALKAGHPQQAFYKLPTKRQIQFGPQDQQKDFYELTALICQRLNQPITSVRNRLALESLMTEPDEIHNNELIIWDTLLALTPEALDAARMTSGDRTDLKGWIELAYVAKQYGNQSKLLVEQVHRWHDRYPDHSGNRLLPDLEDGNIQLGQAPQQIALLLPLQGELRTSGKAIHNGFFAAYYRHRWKTNPRQIIRVYDTASGESINRIYEQAISDGADLIVGPLTKENVSKIRHNGKREVTTLALNSLGGYDSGAANFYQFGLSPQIEAQQVADKAWQAGHRRAIMITPAGSWGEGIAQVFKQRWQMLGGQVVDALSFTPGETLGEDIQNLLQVKEEYLKRSAKKLKNKLPPNMRRRQDMDMFFVVANPLTARQILPLLRFYFAGKVPVYATSLVYTGIPNARSDRDLNGIYFCDMPWLLTGETSDFSRRRIAKLWPHTYDHYVRLYAFGMDAYLLASQIDRVQLLPQIALPGKSGDLYLITNGHIYRKLSWAQFRQGLPTTVQHTT